MPIRVAVLDNINLPSEIQKQIRAVVGAHITFPEDDYPSEKEMVERTGEARAILISPRAKITANYLKACPSVKYVGLCGTSTANVDLDALAKRGVSFTKVIDYGDEPTAEFIFMQLTALARGMGKYQWKDTPRELMGKSIGIIGLGALGKAIANLAVAYKMKVSYFSKTRKPEWEERGLSYAVLDGLLSTSDIIVLSTPTNVRLLGEEEFSLIHSGSVLVQASAGDAFDRDAFLAWIAKEGNYALFDYAAGEQNYQAYKDLPRVVFPKVVAGSSQETRDRLGRKVLDNLVGYLRDPSRG